MLTRALGSGDKPAWLNPQVAHGHLSNGVKAEALFGARDLVLDGCGASCSYPLVN